MSMGDKGQIHTIEGLMASLIMLLVLVLVINSTAVTPLSSSTTNKHVQLELMNMGGDLLASLDYNPNPIIGTTRICSPLKESVLQWNGSQFVWDGKYFQCIGPYNSSGPQTAINDSALAKALNLTFSQHGIAYDVEVIYIDDNNNAISKKMIWNGDPSDNSVTVSRMLVIHDSDSPDGSMPLNRPITIPVPPADDDPLNRFYNIVYVRLTLWRM